MAAPLLSSSDQQKKALRAQLRASRPVLSPDALKALTDRLFNEIIRNEVQRVGAVWPMPGEVDLRPLCARLCHAGFHVSLPETPPKGSPLVFRQWNPGSVLQAGRYGTFHPHAPEEIPELLLVPFLAFDRRGVRLGYGGGYYDRTLERLRVPAIGFGVAAQERSSLPTGPHDVLLPCIVTERETIHTPVFQKG